MILLSQARGGRTHDKRQLEEAGLVEYMPDEVAIEGDLGSQGLQNEFDNVHLPHKKPKEKELTHNRSRKTESSVVNESSMNTPMQASSDIVQEQMSIEIVYLISRVV